jgi:hypothetical protein
LPLRIILVFQLGFEVLASQLNKGLVLLKCPLARGLQIFSPSELNYFLSVWKSYVDHAEPQD